MNIDPAPTAFERRDESGENDNPLLALEPKCPWCRKDHDVGEIFDGRFATCANCGCEIVAVAYGQHKTQPAFMCMEKAYGPGSLKRRRNSHVATQARRRKRGWR